MPSRSRVLHRFVHTAKDHFIPHEGNGYHPHALKHRVLLGYSLGLLLLKLVAVGGSIFLPSANTAASAITSENIIALTTASRREAGLADVEAEARLSQAAQAKAEDMAAKAYFSHTSPSGVTPWFWIKKFGYAYRYSAENLAVHFTQAEDVQTGWLASPGHRANIIDPRYRHIGVGIAVGQYEGFPSTFVVEMFGTPKQTEVARSEAAVKEPIVARSPSVPDPGVTATSVKRLAQVKAATDEIQDTDREVVSPSSRLDIVPIAKGRYAVRLEAASTTKATVHVVGNSVDLTPDTAASTTTWVGTIDLPAALLAQGGEPMYLSQEKTDGSLSTQAAALFTPDSGVGSLFGANSVPVSQKMTLFRFLTIENLQDSVKRVYVFFLVFLAAAMLTNVLVKIRIQKLSVLAHGLFVLVLGSVLYLL